MTALTDAFYNFQSTTGTWIKDPNSPPAAKIWHQWATDLYDMVLSKGEVGWTGLNNVYQSAWLGELKRRNQLAGVDVTATLAGAQANTPKMAVFNAYRDIIKNRGGLNVNPVTVVKFTQYCINNKFAGQVEGSPGWLASRSIFACAKDLRNDPTLSNSLRPTLYHHAGQWVALNNRGVALHALAGATPVRFGFRDTLNGEESGRANVDPTRYVLNFTNSLPANRRSSAIWNGYPLDTVAVMDGSPTNNQGDPIPKDVLYTIKSLNLDASDLGNNNVMKTYNEAG